MHKPPEKQVGHRQGHGHAPSELKPEVIKAGHELGDVPLKPIFNFMIGLTILAAVSFAVVFVVFRLFAGYKARTSEQPTPMAARQAGQLPPQPRLQTDPLKEWVVFKAEQDSIVATYGWVDKGKGIVRLPQERALEVMAGQTWPHRPGHYALSGVSTEAGLAGGAAAEAPAHAPESSEAPAAGGH